VVVTRWPGFPCLIVFYAQYIDVFVLLVLHEHFKQSNQCPCSWKDGKFGFLFIEEKLDKDDFQVQDHKLCLCSESAA
jgi:hypothetical protein